MEMKLSSTNKQHDVIVIGAGHNGLTAAAMLAKAGRKVVVLERRPIIGGLAAGEEFHPGYRTAGLLNEAVPSRQVIEALRLDRSTKFSLQPHTLIPQREGSGLLLKTPFVTELRTAESVAAAKQLVTLLRGLAAALGKFTTRIPPPFDGNVGDLLGLLSRGVSLRRLGKARFQELLRIPPMCVADWLDELYESPLHKAERAAAAILGSFAGPRSPGTAGSLLHHLSLVDGQQQCPPWQLVTALEAAATKAGVEIRTNAEVAKIRVENGRTTGVVLANGETVDAAVVCASCDPKTTFLRLLAARDVPTKLQEHIRHFRTKGVTAKVNLAIEGPLRFACRPELDVHRAVIAESLDDIERAFDAAKYRRCSDRPILDVSVPTVADRKLAPDGHSVASILVHYAPYDLADGWNDAQRDRLGAAVVNVLAEYAPQVKSKIVAREVLSPLDIESRYGVTGGHIHHGDHTLDQLIVRPAPQCARYRTPIGGLYLCGSGSHPGGGLTCLPGFLAAKQLLKQT